MSFLDHFKKFGGFPVRVIILQKAGDTVTIQADKAKRIASSDGSIKYYLKGIGKYIKPPELDSIYVDAKGKRWLFLSTVDMVQFVATKINFKTKGGTEMVPVDKDMINWLISTYKQGMEKYKKPTFWQQYGGIITMFGLVVGFAIIMNVTIGYLEAVGNAMGTLSQQFLQAANTLATCQQIQPIP